MNPTDASTTPAEPTAPQTLDQPGQANGLSATETDSPMGATNPVTPPTPNKPKNKLKLAVVAAVAVLVLVGGSAGAYFGIVVPNKPQNVLKKSVENLSKQSSFTAKGKIDVTGPGTSAAVDMNMLHVDGAKKQALVDMTLTVSGIKVPVEVRYLDSTAYVKLGDLSTIKNLVGGYAGEAMSPAIDAAEKKISNQWVEIDKTLLNQYASESKCTPDEITTKTQAVLNEAAKAAADSDQTFYTIKNSSKDTVDGKKVTKLELSVDKAKLAEFGKKTEELPAAKELAKCSQSTVDSVKKDVNPAQTDISEFNVWVDGSKNIKRFEVKMVDGTNEKTTTTIDMTMVKDAPKVEKPEGAKPFMQLYSEVIGLFGGGDSSFENLSGSLSL